MKTIKPFPGQVALYLPYSLFKVICRIAKGRGCSVGNFIAQLVAHEIETTRPQDVDGHFITLE